MFNREIVWGRDGNTGWLELSDSAYVKENNNLSRNGDSIIVNPRQGNDDVLFGENDWKSYEIGTRVTQLEGANAQIMFRICDTNAGHYLVDFLHGWGAIAVSRFVKNEGLKKLSVVNFDLRMNIEYELEIAVRDYSITTYVDGHLVNQVSDDRYSQGKISLSAFQSKVRYRKTKYRVLG